VDPPRDDVADDNPFSTRYVRPGAIPFQFPAGESAASIVARLRDAGWRGEIIGPHGAGKSSLLQALMPPIRDAGRQPRLIQLHAADRRIPIAWRDLNAFPPETLLLVDGYEQLSGWARFRLRRLCDRKRFGLVVTAHEPTGLATLYRFQPDRAALVAVVQWLLRHETTSRIASADVDQAFDACSGNIRETLFRLYDIYEERRRDPARRS
jgi:hypothetical protein